MSAIIDSVIHILFPHRCISCGETLMSGMLYACEKCKSHILPLQDLSVAHCESCSRPLLDPELQRCYQCYIQDTVPFSNISLFSYQDVLLQDLYKRFKFESSLIAGREFCHIIDRHLKDEINSHSHDILCPVPVSRPTLRKRGFNQIKFVLKELSIEYKDLLQRKNHKSEQNKLNFTQRETQIMGQFSVKDKMHSLIKDKEILLIDDIYTTGSTSRECRRILLNAGASGVKTLSFLRS